MGTTYQLKYSGAEIDALLDKINNFQESQSDWAATDTTGVDFIWNKPPIIRGDGVGAIVENQVSGNTKNAASGNYSHAEGDYNIAGGAYSHAEGYLSTAAANYAHAEGAHAIAAGNGAHAEGLSQGRVVIDTITAIDGLNITVSTAHTWAQGTHLVVNGKLHTIAAQVSDTIYTLDSAPAAAVGDYVRHITYGAFGDYSHTEGSQACTTREYSHAEGDRTVASGAQAHAEGSKAQALGDSSHAEGSNTVAAGAYGAHAEGGRTLATGHVSHTEGGCWKAFEGLGAEKHLVAMGGGGLIASGNAAHAEGIGSVADGIASHAGGFGNQARGDGSMAMGIWYRSEKLNNAPFSFTNQINGHAYFEGSDFNLGVGELVSLNSADGVVKNLIFSVLDVVSLGNNSYRYLLNGTNSNLFDDETYANPTFNIYRVKFSTSFNEGSFAFGENINVSTKNGTAVGQFNQLDDGNTLFAVGNGSVIKGRSNAFEVKTNGAARIEGVLDAKGVKIDGEVFDSVLVLRFEDDFGVARTIKVLGVAEDE